LVNPRQSRHVPGRPKSDVHDCQWLQRLQMTTNSVVDTSGGGMKRVSFQMVVDSDTIAAAVLFTLSMGFLGGLLPALSAMRQKPLESLR
jgi:ABC-type antimicrobial peptide transport system permease subunit